jgi:hypothetical protein
MGVYRVRYRRKSGTGVGLVMITAKNAEKLHWKIDRMFAQLKLEVVSIHRYQMDQPKEEKPP